MLPAANLLGFSGQELSRKIPNKAIAVVMETTCGSIVELILFMVLLKTSKGNSNVQVIKAAILGSILANLLLCLGSCFIAGGIKHDVQEFHSAVSENGSGLMLVASSTFFFASSASACANPNSGACSARRFLRIPLPEPRL
jgi:Ca2+:H+ antiporter